ncbi:hypothetical protein [Nostoc sp. TCL240-02]|uniref:hypothetical protein n=1 Tax=Nostoc sp. TCL240-02 TaxID=2572090 RepID=UPI00157FA62D|nr:hypothetical protein [Nostoc sp. TCL240-02]
MISEKIRKGTSRMGGFPNLSDLALCYRREYDTKPLIMVRYELRSNTPYNT